MDHWKSIDQFVCLSLREAVDRRQKVQTEFDRVGLNVHFIISDRPPNKNGFYGCYTSHQKALRHAKLKGYNRMCIFEDDLYFVDTDKVRQAAFIFETFAATPTPWDAFLLGWYPLRAQKTSDKNVLRVLCGGQTHAYIANKSLIDRGLPDVSPESLPEVDMLMFCSTCADTKRYLRQAKCDTDLNIYALARMIALQPMDTSSILKTKGDMRARLMGTKLLPPTLLQHTVVYIPTLHFGIFCAISLLLVTITVLGFSIYGFCLIGKKNDKKRNASG